MATIVTRAGKGSPLTNNEVDANFVNLNNDKVETSVGVVTTGSYSDPAWITSLNGSKLAGTVVATNGVVTTGSYADPAWITSLAETKVLPSQTGNNGKYLTTNGTSTSWATLTPANDGTLTMNVSGTGLSGSATFSANQAGASTFTVTSNATSANTVSTIVARDASGNFSAGTITATLNGNAATATSATTATTASNVANALTIGTGLSGSSYNGSSAVTIALANTAVTPGSYTTANITVDAQGRITAASSGSGGVTSITGTANQITASASTGAVTLSLPSSINVNAATVTDGVYLSGAQTISGAKTFSAGPILNNEVPIQAKDTGGTTRSLLRVNNGNNILLVNVGNGSFLFRNQADTSTLLTVDNAGNLTAAGDVTANSDERLKTNIQVIPNALAKVEAVRGVTFTRKADNSNGIGVIAQEIQKVAPEAVIVGEDGIMSVAYGNLVGLLIEAVKELSAEVKELKQKVGE